ncbi:MAG TPA: UDP-N-acetylmuramate--L-alanine ligase [Phycisphaerales bacterium]|nr:UDP-N-acetylmuramate--L-alanine ligase [Phycisphaerales bacterium]
MPDGMETERKTSSDPASATSRYAGRKIHLIGVAGAGMRALARMLLDYGASVSGSDMSASGTLDRLVADGAKIGVGQKPENIPPDCELVVFSVAIHPQNPELVAARERGLEVVKYSEMLGRLMGERTGVAVSGTHGKSTTTAMVAYVLTTAGMDPSYVVGATVEQLGGPSGVGAGRHFVAEACEFDRSFLNLHPHYAAVLNIEEDHLDCYQDLEAIIEAFRAFVARVDPAGVVVANGEDRNVAQAVRGAPCEVQTFGLAEGCTWRGVNLASENGRYRCDVLLGGQEFCRLQSPLPGLHNLYNSLAATALLHLAGVSAAKISRLLGGFSGTHRRMTLKAQNDGVTVLDDYAHHPTEIQATLRALRECYQPRRLVCVFQPHQHSRTRFLLKDFSRSFAQADEVIVPDIYFVRDSARERDYISSQDLVSQIRLCGGAAIYLKTFEDITEHLEQSLQPGDLVVTMGAGNIWEVADEIVRWLGNNR